MSNDYRFMEHDPVLDVVRTAMQRHGNLSQQQIDRVAYDSGVSPGTIRAWLNLETKKPLSITTRFVLEALGVTVRYEMDGKAIREAAPTLISASEQRKIVARDKESGRARLADR